MTKKKVAKMGGIVSTSTRNGYCFKVTFDTAEEANHYKEMMGFILKNDKYIIEYGTGYYDTREV